MERHGNKRNFFPRVGQCVLQGFGNIEVISKKKSRREYRAKWMGSEKRKTPKKRWTRVVKKLRSFRFQKSERRARDRNYLKVIMYGKS